MFVRDNLQNLEIATDWNFPNTKFFMILTGLVIASSLLFAAGWQDSAIIWRAGLIWTVLAMILLLFISAGMGLIQEIPRGQISRTVIKAINQGING